jgi:carbamoyltransferase
MGKGNILGVSAFYHDSAAVILADGEIVAAAQEERFTRKKHDAGFPGKAIRYVLLESGLQLSDLDIIAFYDKPYLKFERLLETYHSFAPRGLRSFLSAMPVWIKEKLFMKKMLWEELEKIQPEITKSHPKLFFPEHHLSHAASAFYPSPFEDAAILTIDGVGEWATTTIGFGQGSKLSILKQQPFPHSLGLLYSAFTYYCGFRVNSGEYKLMGLAPYGNGASFRAKKIQDIIYEHLVDLREDGSLLLNMEYFDFAVGLTMCNNSKWNEVFGFPKRNSESELTQEYMDMALAIQLVTEEVVSRLAKTAKHLTGCKNLVLAGGVALNCVANGKLLKSSVFEKIWVQPAAGDAGGALGAAYAAHYIGSDTEKLRKPDSDLLDSMKGSYLGPAYDNIAVERMCRKYKAIGEKIADEESLCSRVAGLLADGQIVGWFQGRMEWGPRALGNRSILGDPRNPEMQKKLNLKIKYREGFRPFAPSVLLEDVADFFELDSPGPYMQLVVPVKKNRLKSLPEGYESLPLFDRLYHIRSDIPAVTHVDFSARVQTVHRETNELYWKLITAFKEKTGFGLVVNTSFNVRGEPIVCSPDDAYHCFMRTEMDWLVINNYLFSKTKQEKWQDDEDWQNMYELD